MYAIIETGGKQYKVQKDDIIEVELLHDQYEDNSGKKVEFDTVLLVANETSIQVGSPHVKAKVLAEILGVEKGPKVLSYKYKIRGNYRRKTGHRQKYSKVKILDIVS